jgi:hypothetical protein
VPERQPRRDSTRNGRIPFVWVEDADTKHRYDVLETQIEPGMTLVPDYDPNYSGKAREPKFYVTEKGASQSSPATDESGDATAARKATSAKLVTP